MTLRIALVLLLLTGVPALALAEETGTDVPPNADLLRFPTDMDSAPAKDPKPVANAAVPAKSAAALTAERPKSNPERNSSKPLAVPSPRQSVPEERAKAEPKQEPARAVRIALETRQLILSDAFIRLLRDRRGVKKLPPRGAGDVLDPQQASLLLAAAAGERRGHEAPAEVMLKLTNGERHELSPIGPRNAFWGNDAVTATLSDDRKTVQLQLTWARRKDTGKERLPTIHAAVPLGSHLIVHTATLSEAKPALSPLAELDQYAEKLLGVPQARPELQQRFLLITPSIAIGEREERLGKKDDDRSTR
jgi:pyruvate/2-oxoglutarate dehydrogenase complex dihydrolipoamide acyltransferase (E2) component